MRWAAGCVLFLMCATANADLREEARLHYELGKQAYGQQRWADALGEFQRAYQAAPLPDLLFNIAHCEEKLGRLKEAADSYRHFLAVRPDAPERAEIEEHIVALVGPQPKPVPVPMVVKLEPVTPTVSKPATPTPVYRRWWLWTTIGGAVAIGVGVGLGVGLTRTPSPPTLGFPGVTVR
jgi:tetratricopeptide (TPR) repeat protein